jgi:CubicO group peptidase (beta-lactamase class C family)
VDETVPGTTWQQADPEAVGLDADALAGAAAWIESAAGTAPYRVVVVRYGCIVAEWCSGMAPEQRLGMASATKSLYSCILGIAVAEGRIGSTDDRLIDYFPEFMDVPDGRGPKPGRFAKPEDRDITFRQLLSNTSGYMKPGETPGRQFHYQTFGMNVLCHGIERAYGLYDTSDPERLPGIGRLIQEKLRDPIEGSWTYRYTNFDHPPEAVVQVFGYGTRCDADARDLARIGLLWLRAGRWGKRQVVPEQWMREATRTAPDILAHCPADEWCYGHAFWTNDHGVLWPSLPRDSFAASGAGRIHVWVCPSLDLVVAQSPGVYEDQRDNDYGLLRRVAAAAGWSPTACGTTARGTGTERS